MLVGGDGAGGGGALGKSTGKYYKATTRMATAREGDCTAIARQGWDKGCGGIEEEEQRPEVGTVGRWGLWGGDE